MPTFFRDDDYIYYIECMRTWCDKHGVSIWAYCLMRNHVHLVAVPEREDGLRLAVGEAHRRYTLHVNRREGWTGHLWQGRFSSYVMDEAHLLAAARYVERNPVRAGMVAAAGDYPWSSARAHLAGEDDLLVKAAPLLSLTPDWKEFLDERDKPEQQELLRQHERTGRPLGDDNFFQRLKAVVGADLRPRKPGPKRKN